MAPLPRRLHVAVGTGLLGASLSLGCTDEDVRVNAGPEQKTITEPPNTNPGPKPTPEPEPKPTPELQPTTAPERPVNVNTRPDPREIEPLHVNEGPMPAPEQAPPDAKVNPGPNTPTAPTL